MSRGHGHVGEARPGTVPFSDLLGKWALAAPGALLTTPHLSVAVIFGLLASHSSSSLGLSLQAYSPVCAVSQPCCGWCSASYWPLSLHQCKWLSAPLLSEQCSEPHCNTTNLLLKMTIPRPHHLPLLSCPSHRSLTPTTLDFCTRTSCLYH